MTMTAENETTLVNEEALARRWKERCASSQFSQAVLGLGTIRVMGKAGDAPVQFPRITSLDTLSALEPDEQWAVRAAQAIVSRPVTNAVRCWLQHPHSLTHSPCQNP